MMMNILLTGPPGIGKTTAIQTIVERLGSAVAGGFWSREIRQDRQRVGFEIISLAGELGILAHVKGVTGPRLGKYRINVADIERVAVPAMRAARETNKIIIVDEIAKMELFSQSFRDEVSRCLDTGRVIGTIQQRSLDFLDAVRARPDVLLLTLTKENRVQAPEKVLGLLDV
ncbi:MAG: NTPase [Candidatus Thorarchaeota archaeon]|nr:NTPase [Candidatus Thorarchaeota archaeon]